MRALSQQTRFYIFTTILTGLAVAIWDFLSPKPIDLWMVASLSILASLSLIFKVVGATDRSHYNISFLIYSFTFIICGAQAAIIVIVVSNVVEWIYHRYPWYIQSFNLTSYLITLHLASITSRAINPGGNMLSIYSLAGVLAGLAVFTLVNHLLVGIVVWLARGESFAQSGVFDFFPLLLDFSLLANGAGAAFIWTINPFATILSLIPLYLIYTTLKVPALERKSNTDAKTGLYNSEYFTTALQSELARMDRFNHPLTVVMGDLDLLRNINNTYGHLAGDTVLVGIANILKNDTRDYDLVARFGGEEFAIVMPEITPEQAFERIEAVRLKIAAKPFVVTTSVTPIQVTMSFGIAGRQPGSELALNELIHNADLALYHAKLTGRNRAVIYTEQGSNPFEVVKKEGYPIGQSIGKVASEQAVDRQAPPALPAAAEPQSQPADKAEETQPAKKKEPRGKSLWTLRNYLTMLVVFSIGFLALIFQQQPPVDWLGLIYFAALVAITEWFSVDIYIRDTSVSTSAAPMLAGFLVFGATGVAILSLTFAIVAMIKHQSQLSRLVFNTGNQVIAGSLCFAIVLFSGGNFEQRPALLQLAICLLSSSAVYLVTSLLLALVIELSMGTPFKQVWKDKFAWLLPYYLALGLIAYTLIYSYTYKGLIGLLAALAPLFILRFSQRQYINRTKTMVNELQEKNTRLENSSEVIHTLNNDLLNALAEAIELRDHFVMGHSKHVSIYAAMISKEMGLSEKQMELIRKAGLLHDVGKLGIPEAILFKPGRLTVEEYNIVKQHVYLGTDIVRTMSSLQQLTPVILHHHEHYDGGGYPGEIRGEEIPLEARIIAVADAVEAMASDRPYRKALTISEILSELKRYAGRQFDPKVVDAFLRIVEKQGEAVVVNSAEMVV